MFDDFYKQLPKNLDDPTWLSKGCVYLTGLLYTHNTQMAEAELMEKKIAVNLLAQDAEEGQKRISVSEAEKRAVVATENRYGRLKAQQEAIVETIQSIKKRLAVLEQEWKGAKYGT